MPPEIDLSDPSYAEEWYSTASYALPNGTTVWGGPISYGSTIRHRDGTSIEVFETHVTGEYLTKFGFVVPDNYPRYTGDVPTRSTIETTRSDWRAVSLVLGGLLLFYYLLPVVSLLAAHRPKRS